MARTHPRRERGQDEAFVDAHLDSVYAAACLVIGDRDQAASATVEAFGHVCRTPVRVSRGEARCHLLRGLYLWCMQHTAPATSSDGAPRARAGSDSGARAGLRGLSLQQRAVIALRIHGQLDSRGIADAVSLPVPEVVGLMRTGLLDLRGHIS